MGFGPPEEDKNTRVAHFQRSASGAETSGRGRDVSPIRGQISPLRPAGGPPVEMTKRNRRLIHD